MYVAAFYTNFSTFSTPKQKWSPNTEKKKKQNWGGGRHSKYIIKITALINYGMEKETKFGKGSTGGITDGGLRNMP